MVKTILNIDGMMCGMCHLEDNIFSLTKCVIYNILNLLN